MQHEKKSVEQKFFIPHTNFNSISNSNLLWTRRNETFIMKNIFLSAGICFYNDLFAECFVELWMEYYMYYADQIARENENFFFSFLWGLKVKA